MAANVRIQVTDSLEIALRKFKKQTLDVKLECQKREYFRNKRDMAKWKHDLAIRRAKNKKFKNT